MRQVKSAVSRLGGPSAAARELGIERTVLHRFCQKGRALERTRSQLRAGLARIENAHASALSVRIEGLGPTPSVENLMAARRIFGSMIELIDVHVDQVRRSGQHNTQSDGVKDNHGRG